jgi:hypothetical protein
MARSTAACGFIVPCNACTRGGKNVPKDIELTQKQAVRLAIATVLAHGVINNAKIGITQAELEEYLHNGVNAVLNAAGIKL